MFFLLKAGNQRRHPSSVQQRVQIWSFKGGKNKKINPDVGGNIYPVKISSFIGEPGSEFKWMPRVKRMNP